MTALPVSPTEQVPEEEPEEDLEEDFEEDFEEEEEPALIYFLATYPVVPPALTLYQLPVEERIFTEAPSFSTLTTLLSVDALFRMFSELAVTVPEEARA